MFSYLRKAVKCTGCPLCHKGKPMTPFSTGDEYSIRMVIIKDFPTKEEFENRKWLEGGEGYITRQALEKVGIGFASYIVTSRVLCHCSNKEEFMNALPYCESFQGELNNYVKMGIKTFVAMAGDRVLEELGIMHTSDNARGSIFNIGGVSVIPTYKSKYIMSGNKSDSVVWFNDLDKANKVSLGQIKVRDKNININPTVNDVISFLKESDRFAVDIETTALYPTQGEILIYGFAKNETDSIVIDRRDFNNEEFEIIKKEMNNVFMFKKVIFHNFMFDVLWLTRKGFGFNIWNIDDTMIMHCLVNPELKHSLNFCCSIYGDIPYWKDALKNKDVSILDMNRDELKNYNGLDCLATFQCYYGIMEDMKKVSDSLVDYYNKVQKNLFSLCFELYTSGVIYKKKIKDVDSVTNDLYKFIIFNIKPQSFEKKFEDLKSSKVGTKKYEELKEFVDLYSKEYLFDKVGFLKNCKDLSIKEEDVISLLVLANNRIEEINSMKNPKEEELEQLKRLKYFLYTTIRDKKSEKENRIINKIEQWENGLYNPKYEIRGNMNGEMFDQCSNVIYKDVVIMEKNIVIRFNLFENMIDKIVGGEVKNKDDKLYIAYLKLKSMGYGDQTTKEKLAEQFPLEIVTKKTIDKFNEFTLKENTMVNIFFNEVKRKMKFGNKIENAFGRVRFFYGNEKEKDAIQFAIQSVLSDVMNMVLLDIWDELFDRFEYSARIGLIFEYGIVVGCEAGIEDRVIDCINAQLEKKRFIFGREFNLIGARNDK